MMGHGLSFRGIWDWSIGISAIKLLFCCLAAPVASAQVPPDTTRALPDTAGAVADSVASDSLQADGEPQDTSGTNEGGRVSAPSDSLSADSLPAPFVLPGILDPAPPGAVTGVWVWSRDDLLGLRGQTLLELVATVPGMLAVRGGDFGAAATAFPVGYSGGGLRVFWDGIEHLPLEGSVPDLSRIPLTGLEGVRVVMRPSGAHVHLFRHVHADVRASSHVDAGTGDPSTNLLRGMFSMPRFLGGKGALAIERLDTEGREGPGALTGAWFRYSLHAGNQAGLRFEARRVAADRTVEVGIPGAVQRTDLTLQGIWMPSDGVVVNGWGTRASAQPGDSITSFPFAMESRTQYGAMISAARGGFWGRAASRVNGGEGVVDLEHSLEASLVSPRWGGLMGRGWRETWGDSVGIGYDVGAWVTPVPHITLFAERGDGRRSVPYLRPRLDTATTGSTDDATDAGEVMDSIAASLRRYTDRTGARYGIQLRWRRLVLGGARIAVQADSIWPTGLHIDRGGLVLPQSRRQGWDLNGSLPLLPDGLYLEGEVQLWDKADSTASKAIYFPDHLYRAGLSFRNTYRESGGFQLWVDLGVQGRSAMHVPVSDPLVTGAGVDAAPASVPFYQSWYFRLQMRILSLNIFATVDNLSLRENNQDLPGRLLLRTRSLYGVRWSFWN